MLAAAMLVSRSVQWLGFVNVLLDPSRHRSPGTFARAGVLLGASALSRPDALVYLPVHLTLAWRGGVVRWRLAALAATVAGLALVVDPWWVRSELVIGRGAGLATTDGLSFYSAHNDVAYVDLPGQCALQVRCRSHVLRAHRDCVPAIRHVARMESTSRRH